MHAQFPCACLLHGCLVPCNAFHVYKLCWIYKWPIYGGPGPPKKFLLLVGVAGNGPTTTGPEVEVIEDLDLDKEIQQELHGGDSDSEDGELREAPATYLTGKRSKAGKVEATERATKRAKGIPLHFWPEMSCSCMRRSCQVTRCEGTDHSKLVSTWLLCRLVMPSGS